jgi:hypothetical protein
MNFNSFFEEAEKTKLQIAIGDGYTFRNHPLDNEALFQLPLISLIILLMAKDRRKPFVKEVGQLVGECLEGTMPAFKGSAQHIGWSANLRVRTVKAMVFLEHAHLVSVENRKGRLHITNLGKKVIEVALNQEDNLASNLSCISRCYRNICVSRQLDLELI